MFRLARIDPLFGNHPLYACMFGLGRVSLDFGGGLSLLSLSICVHEHPRKILLSIFHIA